MPVRDSIQTLTLAPTDDLHETVRALQDAIDSITDALAHLPDDVRFQTHHRIGPSVKHAQTLLTAARAVTAHIAC